jgi:hypothetical protein
VDLSPLRRWSLVSLAVAIAACGGRPRILVNPRSTAGGLELSFGLCGRNADPGVYLVEIAPEGTAGPPCTVSSSDQAHALGGAWLVGESRKGFSVEGCPPRLSPGDYRFDVMGWWRRPDGKVLTKGQGRFTIAADGAVTVKRGSCQD